jgi:MFS family permease
MVLSRNSPDAAWGLTDDGETVCLNVKTDENIQPTPSLPTTTIKSKFTLYLFLCVLTVSSGAFQFGYNISSLNPLTYTIKAFISDNTATFKTYHDQLAAVSNTTSNITEEQSNRIKTLEASIDEWLEVYWAILNSLFVVGGMIGALTSKLVINRLGRKRCLFFLNMFGVAGGVLALIAPYLQSAWSLLVSRLFFGYQSGLLTCVSPIYLSEIAPLSLRGQVGTFPQIGFTVGVLFAQILAFKEILGKFAVFRFIRKSSSHNSIASCSLFLLYKI